MLYTSGRISGVVHRGWKVRVVPAAVLSSQLDVVVEAPRKIRRNGMKKIRPVR